MTENKETSDKTSTSPISRLKLSITKTQALEIAVMMLILVICITIRILPVRYGAYYTGYDPFFQYRVTEYVAKNGYSAYFEWHDAKTWYPMGRNIATSSFPGIAFSAATIYHVLNNIGVKTSVYDIGLYFPIFMAVLTCIATFYLGKDIGGPSTGLLSAFFMAISIPFIRRSSFAFFDTENIGIFGMVTTSLFFIRSIEEKKIEIRTLYALLSGLSLGYVVVSWGAGRYIIGVLMVFLFTSVINGSYKTRFLTSYCITVGIGLLMGSFVPNLGGFNYLLNVENLAALTLVIAVIFYEILATKLNQKQTRSLIYFTFLLFGVFILLLPVLGIGNMLPAKFLKVLNPFQTIGSKAYYTIAEHKLPVWATFFQDYGVIIAFSLFGTYQMIKNRDSRRDYILLYFLTSVYFAGNMSRLSQIMAAPTAVMGAYGLVELSRNFIPIITKKQEPSRRRRRRIIGSSKLLGGAFIVFLLITVIPVILNSSAISDSPTSLAMSAVPVMFNGEFPDDWLQALNWMKENTSEDAVIASWWDYGYWITSMTNRTTLADGATMHGYQLRNLANIMLNPQNVSAEKLRKYGADYILVFYTFNPNYGGHGERQYEWPFGDNTKWQAMALIGRLNITEYVNPYTGQYTDKFTNSTIANLMYRTPDEQYFQEAFFSENNFVLIYEVVYPSESS